jgi:hypothetical protein
MKLNTRDDAVHLRLLEDWEERRADELTEQLSDEFEGGLGDAIEEELEALQAAE